MSVIAKAGLSEKIGYGFGDMSSSMFWKIFSYYLPFFYSNIFGLSLAHAGTLVLVTKLYDAVSDPVMGLIADRTNTRWGKYRPYLLWIAIPFAVAGVLAFFTPQTDNYTFKHVYAYVTYILMMTVYTAINVPYGAMLGVMTDDSREKSVFSSFRMFFAFIGSFIAMGSFEPLLKLRQSILGTLPAEWTLADSTPADWTIAVSVIGIVCAVLFILSFLMTRERVTEAEMAKEPVKENSNETAKTSVAEDLKALVANGPWWMLLGGGIAILLFNCVRGGAAAYYFADVLGTNAIFTLALFLTVGEISQLVGVVVTVPVSEKIGKKATFLLVLVAVTVLSIIVAFLPETPEGMWALLVSQILICIAIGINSPLLWSMFADVADYSELKNGRASTGLIFSSSSMAQKFGAAFGSAIVLWVLMAFGYDNAKGAVQTPEALATIKALISWIPAIGSAAGIAIMLGYPLTDKKMSEIHQELSKKR
ncbi:transporter major facilitator family protein [Bacteroides sp. CAG:709]|nr:transporter major facilitator family protein [Bacteroides sp. CAG:709]